MSLKLEHRLAEIIRGYLDTDASRTAGVPTIPVRMMDDGTDAVTPRLVVVAEMEGEGGSRTVDVHVNLHGILGTERGQTTREQASAWISEVDERCRDRAALNTYIAALSEAVRTGFQILRLTFPAPPPIDRETEGDIILRVTLRFACRV
jgi:hypothetical protein